MMFMKQSTKLMKIVTSVLEKFGFRVGPTWLFCENILNLTPHGLFIVIIVCMHNEYVNVQLKSLIKNKLHNIKHM